MKSDNFPINQDLQSDEIDLLDLVAVLIKRKKIILGITFFAMIFILGYSVISLMLPPEKSYLPNLYKPTSLVMINSANSGPTIPSGLASLAGLGGVSSGSNSSALAIKIAQSNQFLDEIALDLNLYSLYVDADSESPKTDLRKLLKSKMSIESDDETSTLTVGFEDIDKVLATKITNYIVESLENEFLEIDLQKNSDNKVLLEQKIKDIEENIAGIEQDILTFQSKYGLIDANQFTSQISQQVISIKTEILNIDSKINIMESRLGKNNPVLNEKKWEKKSLEDQLILLEEKGASGIPPLNNLPELTLQFNKLKRNLEIQSMIYKGLRQQYEQSKLVDRGNGKTFQVLEKASIPEVKSGPSRGKLCIIVTMAAFFLSIFLVFLLEFWDNLKADPIRMEKLNVSKKRA